MCGLINLIAIRTGNLHAHNFNMFISVEEKETSDDFVVFAIRNLVTPFHTHFFIVSSLSANVTIYKCTII